jgi:flagellar capping protein FliD
MLYAQSGGANNNTISIPGLSSRFDIDGMVDAAMKVASQPRDNLQQTNDDLKTQESTWNDLGNKMKNLRDAADALYSYQNPFNDRSAKSSDDSVLSATAGRTATPGKQSFTVEQLATADRYLSKPLPMDLKVPAGSYSWQLGGSGDSADAKAQVINLDFGGGSLGDFVSAANKAGGSKVKFSVISVKQGSQSLLVESQVTGADERLNFSDALTGHLAVTLGLGEWPGNGDSQYENFIPSNMISQGQDAKISMDGIEITRPNNNIDDVIPGLTLSLHKVSPTPVSITVTGDTDSVKNGIINLVGNYNQLMAEINVLTYKDDTVITELTYLTDDQKKDYEAKLGTMMGDPTLNAIKASLSTATQAVYPTSDPKISILSQIGISTNTSKSGAFDMSKLRGYLEIDESTLDKALASDMNAVKQLFAKAKKDAEERYEIYADLAKHSV